MIFWTFFQAFAYLVRAEAFFMNFSDLSVKKDLPYPEPVIPYPNPVEAKKLMNDYGGRDSETTAILQYVYQSYVLSREFPEFSKKLAEIAACEMKHQKILGTAIAAYGSFPVIGGRTAFWNGSYVNYATDLIKLLEYDIQGELCAIENYKNTILCIQNNTLKATIERIIEDEELHVVVLKAMLATAKEDRK